MTFREIVTTQLTSSPVSEVNLLYLQSQIKHPIPKEYIDLLQIADGGLWNNQRVIMYSCGNILPIDDQILEANRNRQDAPLFFIGRFAENEFGYDLKGISSETKPIFVFDHENEEIHEIATDLIDFFNKFSRPLEEKQKKWFSFLFN